MGVTFTTSSESATGKWWHSIELWKLSSGVWISKHLKKSFEHPTSNIQSFPIDHFLWFLKLHPQKNEVFYTVLFSYLTYVYSTVVDGCKCCVRPEIAPSSWLCVLAFRITVQTIQIQIQKKYQFSRSMCQSRNCISFDDYSYFIRPLNGFIVR